MKVRLQHKDDFISPFEDSSKVMPAPTLAVSNSRKTKITPIPTFLNAGPLLRSPSLEINLSHLKTTSKKRRVSKYSFGVRLYYWLLEELSFTMNKISLAGLIFGLMVLGSLFFVIGFLAAVATFGTGSQSTPPSWANINQAIPGADSAVGKLAGAVGGKLLQDQAIKLESKMSGGAIAKVVQSVPPSLQPFAAQAQNQLALRAQQNVSAVATGIHGSFAPKRFGAAQQTGQAPVIYNPAPAQGTPQRPVPPAFAPRAHPQQQANQQPLYRMNQGHPYQQGAPVLRPVPMPQQQYQQMGQR